MKHSKREVEILAPCGSYEILIAAIHAGADACYIGGNRFGARAYAENFDQESILEAIDYAHIHGVKLYLTVNTLLKDSEISDLYDYIKPLYLAGLDAVIVQDLGVFRIIRHYFPDLPIHCSTQMNITSSMGASLMKELGATRVVTAREMSIDEIATIHENVDIEIETFVHGAMCYSYSGQCLMSSLAGGRSGNRGRCAQPCRKCYDGSYLLSLKDMCSLEHIPALIEAGVYSLKIEGRMKNASYVASAVHAYKEIVDSYFNGTLTDDRVKELKFELANVFNRGNFSDGYMKQHNGENMISIARPNNQGVLIGEIHGVSGGAVQIKLCETLYKQDVLELICKNGEIVEITTGIDGSNKQVVSVNCPKSKQLKIGSKVFRTRCNKILEHISMDYINQFDKIELDAYLYGKVGDKITFSVQAFLAGKLYKGTASGNILEKAQNTLQDLDVIKKPLLQLGNTDYCITEMQFAVDSDAFIPKSLLKQLRRDAINDLEQNIVHSYKREEKQVEPLNSYITANKSENIASINSNNREYTFSVYTEEQMNQLMSLEHIFDITDKVIINYQLMDCAHIDEWLCIMKKNSVDCFVELPFVVKDSCLDSLDLQSEKYSGIYIRNIDGFAYVIQNENLLTKKIIIGSSLYCYNGYAYDFFSSLCKDRKEFSFEMSRELKFAELTSLFETGNVNSLVYEYQQAMITANCIRKTWRQCDGLNSYAKITDDKKNVFFVRMVCKECINVIYNGVLYSILDRLMDKELCSIRNNNKIIRFTIEDASEVRAVYACITDGLKLDKKSTTGHLFRGVE